MKKLHKMKSLAGLGKAKLKNALRCTLLLIGLLVGVNGAWAQTGAKEIRMKTGNETITDELTYNFYDSGGPYVLPPAQDPNNDYNWVSWYQHNESYLLHLIKPSGYESKGIKMVFNYLLINNDHLKIYEGDLENEENLIVDLTNNDYSTSYGSGFTVISHGNMTIRFESDYHWRDAGWEALVELWDYSPQPPVALMEACDNNTVLLPGSKAEGTTATTEIYYTTDGLTPLYNVQSHSITVGTLYTGPFAITQAPTTVKAILVENGTKSSVVASYTFSSLITPPAAPTLVRVANTNKVIITAPPVPEDQNDTYYVRYSLDTDPQYSDLEQAKADTIEVDHPCRVRAVTRGTTCPDTFSEEAYLDITQIYVPTPEITINGTGDTGTATITCSLDGATIYYTIDGSDPTTTTTTSGSSPITLSVPAGTTVKALAAHSGEAYIASSIASAIYIPGGQGSGVYSNVVLLDDREPHSWSYYSDNTQPVHRLKPADVKITYFGYGNNTMTTTNTDDSGLGASAFDGNVAAADVAVGPNVAGNQFVYLKTLENAEEDGSGDYPYTLIPNPFSKRPTYEGEGGGSTPPEPTIETVNVVSGGTGTNQYAPMYTNYADYGFKSEFIIPTSYFTSAGITSGDKIRSITLYQSSTGNWTATSLTIKLLNSNTGSYSGNNFVGDGGTTVYTNTSYSSGSQSTHTFQFSTPFEYTGSNLVVQISSGHNGTYATTSWYGISSNQGNRQSCYANYASNTATNYTGTTRQRFLPNTTFSVERGSSSSTSSDKYRGFYAWRVKRLSSGLSIKSGNATLGVGSIIFAEDEIEFVAEPNSTENEVDFEALWAQAYVNTSNSASGLHAGVSYERNFIVGAAPNAALSVPVTYSSYNPDGTGGANTVNIGTFTCAADTKFEYMNLNNGTLTANNHDLIMGRGLTGTATTLRGINGASDALDYTLRIESGTYTNFSFVASSSTGGAGVVSGRVQVKAILGSDYDRADKTNNHLTVSNNSSLFYAQNVRFSSNTNMDAKTFDCVVKSGQYQASVTNDGDYTHTFYCGHNYTGTNATGTHYPGSRYVTVEGGELASMNGGKGVNNNITNNGNPQATPDEDTWILRVKGGSFRGSIFGGAANTESQGSRRIVITGGTVRGWVAGGANGTNTTWGASVTTGNSHIYVGGNAIIGGSNPNTVNNTVGGNVFGAGRGNNNQAASMVNSEVVIADNADILHNVYGGGNYGYITTESKVYILGGNIGDDVFGGAYGNTGNATYNYSIPTSNVYVKGGKVNGSVYGGSNYSGTVTTANVTMTGGTVTNVYGGGLGASTRINGDAEVNIVNGTINNNVYGGGALGTVTGNTTVSVSGGTMQNVFGAGLGSTASTANIGGTTTVNVSGGTIAESVYGGGEIGNVKQASNPTAKGEEEPNRDPNNVASTVNITGGNIASNVFGGGRMGFTNGGTLVNMNGGAVEGSVFGGAFGTQGRVYVAGLRVVNMRGGTVNKHVYGGSRNADDALVFNPGTFASSTETGTASVVNYSGGYTHYQVFASGYFGNVFGSTYAFIGTNAILNAPYHVYEDTEANQNFFNAHQALRIGGSVWAGGDFGNYDGSKFGDPTVSGRSNVYIDGTGYDTESSNTTNTNYMYIGGSIYGSGTSCDAGKQGRHIVIQNYGQLIGASQPTAALPYSSATRALYSVQRADSLDIVNSHIVFLGEGKINSLVTTEKYTIYEFNKVRINNGSSIFMNYPADQMKKFGSYKVDNIYNDEPTYTKVSYETSSLEETPNKIRVSNGAYIQVKYVDANNVAKYGELEGFAYMMSDDANNTCAYARPKQSTDAGNTIHPDYDNPNDGGWVSYDRNLNTYNIAGGTAGANSDQMPYENHTLSRNGEDYFRIWRAGGTLSYREGVFVAQSKPKVLVEGQPATTDYYSTVDVTISLPAFECSQNTAYYHIASFDGNTTIDYGTDVMMVNAACYGNTGASEWMYINGDNASANFVTGVDSTNATLKANGLKYIKENPNVNFGLVAIPQNGLESTTGEGAITNENMLICDASDPKIATMKWYNTHNELMPEVTFRLTYHNNLTNNVVWDPIHITFEQVDCNGDVAATVDVALTVTTLTNIEQDFVTQAYAVTRGTGSVTGSYTAKIVLPQYVMHVNTVGEISKWTCEQVTFVPESGYANDLFVGGQGYLNDGNLQQCNNKFGMTMVAGLNFDNTTGWESYPVTPQDMYGWDNPSYVFGETTARDPIGFDFTLLYDGRQKANGNYKVGTLNFRMKFTNYEGAGLEPYSAYLNIKIEVWFLGKGSNYYIDGVHGNNLYSGRYPNAAKKTLSGIFNRTDYVAGDYIFVVNTVTADGNNTLTWNGKAYDQVTIFRYPGGHECVPNAQGADSHYEAYDITNNPAFTGALVDVETNMEMTGIVLDGFYEESQKPKGKAAGDLITSGVQYYNTYQPANAPLVEIKNGGRLSVYGSSRMEHNYNATTDGGGVYIEDGGVLNLYDGSAIDTNYVATGKNGGGIYVNETSMVQLSDVVNITGNQQMSSSKADEGTDNNVYLSTYNSHVNVGTSDTDDPYTMLLSTAKVGITKNPNWGNYYYAPVAYSDGGQAYLGNLVTENAPETGAIMWDDQTRYEILSLNNTHLTNPTNYVYFVGTWVTEVTENPQDTEHPDNFDASQIDTPYELAWLISYVNGLNGATAHPGATATLTGDIDMSANIWVPITNFTGSLEGNGHVVTGLRSPLNSENMGMFGVTNGATISNLVAQSTFAGGSVKNLGTLIGTMNGGTLSNVEAAGRLTGTNATANIGGLVGEVKSGTIHSAFAVDTIAGGTNTVVGGLVGTNGGNLYNSYSNITLGSANTATNMAGLVGVNTGTVENCYVVLPEGFDKPAFVHTNQVTVEDQTTKGNVNYCYAADGTTSYVGADAPGNMTGHGTYGEVLDRKAIGYMYGDNAVDAENDYVASAITYGNGHNITKWPGLLSTLNQWVAAHTGYTPWFRPTSGDINGDLPVLGFTKDNSLATQDGKFLYYGAYNLNPQEGETFSNGLDNLFTKFDGKSANMFLYGNATDVTLGNGSNMLFINEDAVLLQSGSNAINATVGVTFDNSDHGQNAYDYYGHKLEYDWHFMSSPLKAAPIGATYEGETGNGKPVDIKTLAGSYFPNGLITEDNPAVGGNVKWDFYTYFEPEYHWINLKRSGANHWHTDGGAQINYLSGQNELGAKQNETIFVPGKGYMMAISQDSYLSNTGTLNNGDVEIMLTNQEPLTDTYNKGWNLVGNPYQAYLDLNMVGAGTYYIYDAESGVYVPYTVAGSDNPVAPSRYIHPHQGFFMYSANDNTNFTFSTTMATANKEAGSYFRGDDQVNYPLVNLFAKNQAGNRDLAIIEFNRPEIGGATKVSFMTNANFSIAAHLGNESYGLLFTPENTERVPVYFVATEDGTYTLDWSTHNGEFTSLLLVDNKTGVITDMLRADKYTFDASADDYSSRFYITYTVTDVDENVDGESNFAYFDGTDWVINGQGTLDVVDVLGRTLRSERLINDQNRVSLDGVAKGVYLLRVSNGKNTMVQKIVVR